ncbi:MAG: tetraacyldisaccharide 4'-kinase, partial [Nitrospinota bacterium]|nr:tetraacyldisaccharide 4'-kinase [Nitrospinota bacterium]
MQVAQPLYDLVKDENALGTGVDPDFFGDEPFLLAQRNPEVPVYVGSSRVVTAQLAEARDHPDVLVLDD